MVTATNRRAEEVGVYASARAGCLPGERDYFSGSLIESTKNYSRVVALLKKSSSCNANR
jgi:hypothetical protein